MLSCYADEYIKFSPNQPVIPPKPKWPDKFFIEGILSLPYADLDEPFSAWYDGVGKRSRVDMYGGKSTKLFTNCLYRMDGLPKST